VFHRCCVRQSFRARKGRAGRDQGRRARGGQGRHGGDEPRRAEAAIDTISQVPRQGGERIVIEDFLEGEEVSFFALCDGTHALNFASAQDHKRVGEGESGPNTGGMGAYSPAPVMDAKMTERVMQEIVAPTLKGMSAIGAPFKGVLFAGLMLCADGPRLIEYNVRFGDPETQAMLPRLDEDLLPCCLPAWKDGCRSAQCAFCH